MSCCAAIRLAVLAAGSAALGGCHSVSPMVAVGPAAIATTGIANPELMPGAYLLGPADELRVDVLYEPELTLQPIRIDTNGEIQVPLIGKVQAAGKTAAQLASEIQEQLGASYLRNPRVVVNVTDYARQNVTVEGDVETPGVYRVQGTSSLLQAIALAHGPKRTAKLDEVIVFRTVNGQRAAGRFDLRRIRYGYEPDPLILGGDRVVVGYSDLKGALQTFVRAAPAFGVFRPY
ncbi:MAG: polysaccharide export protein [Sphingomonas sp.]|nr:polysaccharide export protein [Sphingomonas sp.]